MSDTPETDAQAYDVGGYQHEDGSIVLSAFARKLERERDRLAEALRQIDNARLNQFAGPHDMALTCVLIARETLASVKGVQP